MPSLLLCSTMLEVAEAAFTLSQKEMTICLFGVFGTTIFVLKVVFMYAA
jgi:hypothetical protein